MPALQTHGGVPSVVPGLPNARSGIRFQVHDSRTYPAEVGAAQPLQAASGKAEQQRAAARLGVDGYEAPVLLVKPLICGDPEHLFQVSRHEIPPCRALVPKYHGAQADRNEPFLSVRILLAAHCRTLLTRVRAVAVNGTQPDPPAGSVIHVLR